MALEIITSPLPGKIVGVKVSAGQKVKEGDLLLIIEAMKMENEIVPPRTPHPTPGPPNPPPPGPPPPPPQ
jgi:acetyl/propionyl-CoA carboxylase alpha subunit